MVNPATTSRLTIRKFLLSWVRRRTHELCFVRLSGLVGPVSRDTAWLSQRYPPRLRAMGFLVSQHGQLDAIPPPRFLSVSPLEHMRSRGAIPLPLKRGISAILPRYPMKTRQMGAITPLCDTISKGYCAIWGGISHWAAKTAKSRKWEKEIKNQMETAQHKDLRAPILYVGGVPLLLYFPGKEPPHKENLGSDPTHPNTDDGRRV